MLATSTARSLHFQSAQDELACHSFLDKFFNSGHETTVELNVCALNEALFSLYLKENKDKILLFYLHNHETEFSTEFCRQLSSDAETINLLQSHFIVHCWDIGEGTYQDVLMETLGSMLQLLPCVDMVKKKQPAVIFIAAVDMDFQICSVLRDIPALNNMNTTMLLLVESIFQEEPEMNESIPEGAATENECGYAEFQQKMLDYLGNRDYDRFEASELENLKAKISFALFGVPLEESGYSEKQMEETEKMFNIILETSNEFSQYENQVTMSIVYNCLVPFGTTSNQQFTPVPVFVLPKCSSSKDPCRTVVDHTRRVYPSWRSYIEDNKFCECLMIAPSNGRYEGDSNGRVKLEGWPSPACKVGKKILKATDITSSVLAIGSTGVMVAAAVPAIVVAPAALLGAAVVGAGVGVYSIGRSISTLVDRGTHKESLNVTEAEARGAYLNIAAGVVGFAGAGANALVSQMAANGMTVGTSARIAVNTLGVANIGIGGLAVSNSAVEIFMRWWIDDETPSALSVLQLSTSILFFGHAVYSFKTAGTIIEETQANAMQSYKDSLSSNKLKKMFRKLELETIRQSGGNVEVGRAEVISAIARMKDKSEVFRFLSKNNKKFNEMGVKFSAKDGQINFNGVALDLTEISAMSWKDAYGYFSNLDPKKPAASPVQRSFNINLDKVMTIDTAYVFLKIVVGPQSLQDKIFQILRNVLRYLEIDKAHFRLIQMMNEMFPKGRWFIQMSKMVLSFVQKKAEEMQRKIDADDLDQTDRTLLRYFKDLDGGQRKLAVLQHVCDGLLLLFQSGRGQMEELLRFCVDWVMSAFMEHSERQERATAVEEGNRRLKVVRCKRCEGEYFEA